MPLGTTWVALYHGSTVASARLVAVSADPVLVADVAARVLDVGETRTADRVLAPLARGRRAALRAIRDEKTRDQEPVNLGPIKMTDRRASVIDPGPDALHTVAVDAGPPDDPPIRPSSEAAPSSSHLAYWSRPKPWRCSARLTSGQVCNSLQRYPRPGGGFRCDGCGDVTLPAMTGAGE
jgi:hypothetical protein